MRKSKNTQSMLDQMIATILSERSLGRVPATLASWLSFSVGVNVANHVFSVANDMTRTKITNPTLIATYSGSVIARLSDDEGEFAKLQSFVESFFNSPPDSFETHLLKTVANRTKPLEEVVIETTNSDVLDAVKRLQSSAEKRRTSALGAIPQAVSLLENLSNSDGLSPTLQAKIDALLPKLITRAQVICDETEAVNLLRKTDPRFWSFWELGDHHAALHMRKTLQELGSQG